MTAHRERSISRKGSRSFRRRRHRTLGSGGGPVSSRAGSSGERRREAVARVAFVTDSASDLDPAQAKADGIAIVALSVTFGDESFRAGEDLSTDEVLERRHSAGAPWPKTAAASPGDFKEVYERLFAEGADAIVSV